MEKQGNKKDLRRLYNELGEELNKIDLPSGEELHQLLAKNSQAKRRGAPYVPLSRPRPVWHYAVAAMLVLALGIGVWMVERNPNGAPVVAEQPDEPLHYETVTPVADSIVQPVPDAPRPKETVFASVEVKEDNVVPETVADSVVEPVFVPVEVDAPLLAVEDTVKEELNVAESKDTLKKPDELPHIIDNYPDKPTVEETDKIIREGNNRRALRGNRKRHINRKKDGFIEKQKEQREGIFIEIKTVPMQTPHFVPNAGGGHTIIYY